MSLCHYWPRGGRVKANLDNVTKYEVFFFEGFPNVPFLRMNDQTTPPKQCQDTGSCDVTPASESNFYSALGGLKDRASDLLYISRKIENRWTQFHQGSTKTFSGLILNWFLASFIP